MFQTEHFGKCVTINFDYLKNWLLLTGSIEFDQSVQSTNDQNVIDLILTITISLMFILPVISANGKYRPDVQVLQVQEGGTHVKWDTTWPEATLQLIYG